MVTPSTSKVEHGRRALIVMSCAALVAAGGLAFAPTEWPGWLLMFFSIVCVVLTPTVRDSRAILMSTVAVVAAHHVVSLVNAFALPLPGAQLDALTFHAGAMKRSFSGEPIDFGVGTHAYQYVLVQLYNLFGGSLFLGQELSVLAATVTCVVFASLLRRMHVGQTACAVLVLALGLTPSFLFYTSVTMREGLQLLFFVIGCALFYHALRSRRMWVLVSGWLMFVVMGLFHQMLLAYAFFAIAVTGSVYFCTRLGARNLVRNAAFIGVGLGLLLWFAWYWIPVYQGNDYTRIVHGGLPESIVRYRDGIMGADPRSGYGFDVVAAPLWKLTWTLARSYAHYMFGPYAFSVSSPLDLIAVAESLLRLAGLVAMLYALSVAQGTTRLMLIGLTTLYIGMTLLWSIGTTNYGQALRHHSVSNWILFVGAGVAWTMFRQGRESSSSFR